jgi:CheY-like chemotaxis protein
MMHARVMVVEDERIVALHLRHQLVKLGYEVAEFAASGEQALRQVAVAHPDLILMDIHIDGSLDGIETAARLPADDGIPVIYLTAYSEEATLERARATKPYGYLVKPRRRGTRRKSCRRSASWPAGWHMTSTTCSAPSLPTWNLRPITPAAIPACGKCCRTRSRRRCAAPT